METQVDRLLTIDEAAEILNVSRSHVYRLIQMRELAPVSISAGAKRIDPADLQEFIKSRKPEWGASAP